MRITTQMLNETAQKAGLPIHRSSLLDYVNNDNVGSSGNALLDALQSNNGSQVNTTNKVKYEKIESAADGLGEQAVKFITEDKDNVLNQAKETGDTKQLLQETEALAEKYNQMLSVLQKNGGTMELFYADALKEAVRDKKDVLENIGVTIEKDGSLKVDKDKMKSASAEDFEKALGGDESLAGRLSYVALKVSDNAQANLDSTSSWYSQNGNFYTGYQNKYDLWG